MAPRIRYRTLGRALLIVLAVLLCIGVAVALAIALPFYGIKPAQSGAPLPGDVTLVKDGVVNLYVLPAGDKDAVLIDCGVDPNGAAVTAELRRRGLGPGDVTAILLTHGHLDHTAGCRLFRNAQVLAFEGDRGLIEGREAAKGPLPRFRGRTHFPVRVTRALHDGETVEIGSLRVQAYAVPGHTAGSGAFLANGVLYLGDSVMAESNGRLRPAPWIFSDDQERCVASIKMLAHRLSTEGVQVKALAFGHSGSVLEARALVDFPRGP